MSYHFNELVSWHKCRLQHHYQYVKKYAPLRKPEALDFGGMIHAGLEEYYTWTDYKTERAKLAIKKYCDEVWNTLIVNLQWGPELEDQVKYAKFEVQGEKLLELYAKFYTDKDDSSVLHLEQGLPVQGVDEMVRTVDMITLKDGVRYAWEHKTTSKDKIGFLKSLDCSMEPALTCLAAGTNWIIYNCINKTAGSKEMFWRETLYIPEEQKEIAQVWAKQTIRELNNLCVIPIWDSFICAWCSFQAACACETTGGDVKWILEHNFRIKEVGER